MSLPLHHFFNHNFPPFVFPVGQKIYDMRMTLGARVISEIPDDCPKIGAEFKNILQVDRSNAIVKILLKTPVAVAQSIKNKENDIWNNTIRGENVRRNMKYCTELHPEWFSEALLYSLNQII